MLPAGERILASGSVQLPRFTLLESGSLLVSPARISDAGTYTCLATNSRGVDEASADLVVWGECAGRYTSVRECAPSPASPAEHTLTPPAPPHARVCPARTLLTRGTRAQWCRAAVFMRCRQKPANVFCDRPECKCFRLVSQMVATPQLALRFHRESTMDAT